MTEENIEIEDTKEPIAEQDSTPDVPVTLDPELDKDAYEAMLGKMKALSRHYHQKLVAPMHNKNFPRNQRKIRKNRRRRWAMGDKKAFDK